MAKIKSTFNTYMENNGPHDLENGLYLKIAMPHIFNDPQERRRSQEKEKE